MMGLWTGMEVGGCSGTFRCCCTPVAIIAVVLGMQSGFVSAELESPVMAMVNMELHKQPSMVVTKLSAAITSKIGRCPPDQLMPATTLLAASAADLVPADRQRGQHRLSLRLALNVRGENSIHISSPVRTLCLQVNDGVWQMAGWIFFPPFQEILGGKKNDSDYVSGSKSTVSVGIGPNKLKDADAFPTPIAVVIDNDGNVVKFDNGRAMTRVIDEDNARSNEDLGSVSANSGSLQEGELVDNAVKNNDNDSNKIASNIISNDDVAERMSLDDNEIGRNKLLDTLTVDQMGNSDAKDGEIQSDNMVESDQLLLVDYEENNSAWTADKQLRRRFRREEQHGISNGGGGVSVELSAAASMPGPRILAIRLVSTTSRLTYTEDGRITVLEGEEVHLDVIGFNMDNETLIRFTTSRQGYGEPCGYLYERHTETIPFAISNFEDGQGRITLPADSVKFYAGENVYYACVRNPYTREYIHQGDKPQLQLEVYSLLLPVWLMGILIVVLLSLSGLFSGLNLGLMSLDQTELRIVVNTGSETEKNYAKAIMPIRGMGNFLLCSILLGNVLVNNTLTIILDTLTGGGGIVAVIGATLAIVIFGEIIPQAICSRHGLAVGAKTIWLTKFFMLLTSPLAFPLSKLLDKILGTEIGTVYNRERLMELIKVTDQYTDLEKDEVNIVTGALVLKRKTVKDVMTHLDDCYMLPIETVLNFETISEIKDQGYSRIPVYKGERSNVVHILFARDLLFIDPDDNKPLEEVCRFYKNDVNFVYQDTILTDMFDEFKSGDKGHMALVQEVNNEGEGDPFYETVGLVTLEDIIEEIIQQEIVDETDVVIDNKTKKKRKRERQIKDAEFKMFLDRKNHQRVIITPQISLAVYQFLTTWVKAFSSEVITTRVMQKLLNLDVYRDMKIKTKKFDCKPKGEEQSQDREGMLMMKGRPCDYFILIVEGRVEVTIGKEEHKFIEGPFTTFGEQMLEQVYLDASGVGSRRSGSADGGLAIIGRSQPWVPDYTLRAVTDLIYLKIRRNTYMVALKASRMNNMNSEMADKELDIALERVTEKDANDDANGPNDFERTPSFRSPDKSFEGGLSLTDAAATMSHGRLCTPTELRRSSLHLLKPKHEQLAGSREGKSSISIDSRSKEDFWECSNSDDLFEQGAQLNFNAAFKKSDMTSGGPTSLPLSKHRSGELREMQQQTRSEDGYFSNRPHGGSSVDDSASATRGTAASSAGGGGPTVITVRSGSSSDPHFRVNGAGVDYLNAGGGGGERPHSTSPNDRTSLLQSENPVS